MDKWEWAILVGFLVMMGFIGVGAMDDIKSHKRLMAQCLQDHKEYECEAMLKRSQPAIVPMPIVVR